MINDEEILKLAQKTFAAYEYVERKTAIAFARAIIAAQVERDAEICEELPRDQYMCAAAIRAQLGGK